LRRRARRKGMEIRILSAEEVRRALPMAEAIEAMRGAFRALHAGNVVMPVRVGVKSHHGVTLIMPAFDGRSGLGQKAVSVYSENPKKGLPTVHALVTLFDAESGAPVAIVEGTSLTALRTGAVTGLAVSLLAKEEARVLTIFGAGGTAPGQIEAVCAARPIEQVNIVSRGESARRLAARLQMADSTRRYVASHAEAATREADVLVAATTSLGPVFHAEWVRAGTLVCGVGSYRPDMQEIPAEVVERAAVVVDQREAAEEEAGDLLQPIAQGRWAWERLYGELGVLAAGTLAPPRADIIFFKSCGLAIEDVAAATAVLRVAEREGLGQMVTL
jgi:ornithine cyclodeaminase/alanine dehydrogenase-like protein (mu-crystallin family)